MLGRLLGKDYQRRRALAKAAPGPLADYLSTDWPDRKSDCREIEIVAIDLETTGLDPDKVELGRALFHDTRLSADDTVSCATCHDLAKGGTGVGVELSERDRWIVGQVAPELVKRGIVFAGLDVIGDWLTEINVTSPTCIRELDAEFGLNIAGQLFDAAEARLRERVAD